MGATPDLKESTNNDLEDKKPNHRGDRLEDRDNRKTCQCDAIQSTEHSDWNRNKSGNKEANETVKRLRLICR